MSGKSVKKIRKLNPAPTPRPEPPKLNHKVVYMAWESYLIRVKMDVGKMSPAQFTELRRAWYAACESMIMFMGTTVTEMQELGSPELASAQMGAVIEEVQAFWQKELNPMQPKKQLPTILLEQLARGDEEESKIITDL